MTIFLKGDLATSQDLSKAALSYTTSINKACEVERITLHASVAITEDITITLDSKNGATYDIVLRKKSLVAEQDFIYVPESKLSIQAGDEIKIQCTDGNGTGIVYVMVKTRELS